jgi:hypothetical protein
MVAATGMSFLISSFRRLQIRLAQIKTSGASRQELPMVSCSSTSAVLQERSHHAYLYECRRPMSRRGESVRREVGSPLPTDIAVLRTYAIPIETTRSPHKGGISVLFR